MSLHSTPLFSIRALALAALALHAAAEAQPAQDANNENKRAYLAAGCYACHGTVGQGGVGPRLAPKPMPLPAMSAFVRNTARNMPPYSTQMLPEADMKRIHDYLSSIEASPAVDQIPQLKSLSVR
jgi:ubiquinol-cytochrome c reductase cytochrome c subunit